MVLAVLPPTTHAYLRLGFRGAQFVCCLFALAFTAAGFKSALGGKYSSASAEFTLLMAYTGMLYSLFQIAAIEVFHLYNRIPAFHEQIIDGVLAIALLIAGIALAASDYVSDCDYYNYYIDGLRCGNLKAGVAFSFIGMFFFLLSLALMFVGTGESNHPTADQVEVAEPVPYHAESTPTGALSPIGNKTAETPAQRV